MSSCYSLNLELIKTFSPSNSSESRNSPRSILTRKPRTPRKRPNQTYNEAAAILSTAYPKIFPLTKPLNFTNNRSPPFLSHPDDHGFLLFPPKKTESRGVGVNSLESPVTVCNNNWSSEMYDEEFSAESILDEETEQGIDSIMGFEPKNDVVMGCYSTESVMQRYPDVGLGVRRELRAMRHVDEGDWWRFPCVDVSEQKPKKSAAAGLRLKLDYDDVLKAWSDKASPFSGDSPAGDDVQVRLAQIDLFPTTELPYKEKQRCARLVSKKSTPTHRNQITKLKPDQRPRLKGRFSKTANPIDDD